MTIGDINGVSKSLVSEVVARVTHNIALLKDRFIEFPQGEDQILQAMKDFYDIAPNVIAANDCTHAETMRKCIEIEKDLFP